MRLIEFVRALLFGYSPAMKWLESNIAQGARDFGNEELIDLVKAVQALLTHKDLVITLRDSTNEEYHWVQSGEMVFGGGGKRGPYMQLSIPRMGFYLDYWADDNGAGDYRNLAIRLPYTLRRFDLTEILMSFCLGRSHGFVHLFGDEPYQKTRIWDSSPVLRGHMQPLYHRVTVIARNARDRAVPLPVLDLPPPGPNSTSVAEGGTRL